MSEKGYKYWSDLLNDKFDTEQELFAAEKAYRDREQAKKEKELNLSKQKKQLADEISKQKKQLADEISECDKKIDEALKELESAKAECAKILEESNQQVEKILKTAREKVKSARTAKCDKITEFSNKFGCYTVYYTGDRAAKEIKRLDGEFNAILNSLFSF